MNNRNSRHKPLSKGTCLISLASISFAFALFWTGNIPAQAANKTKEVWHLKQKHVDKGPLDLYIGDNCVKVVSPSGYIFLVKGPDWTVHCFRPGNKEEWTSGLQYFNGLQMANSMNPGYASTTHLKPYGKGKRTGLSYISFTTERPSRTTMLASDQIKTDSHVIDFIARLYYIPNPGLVPLYYYEDKKSKALPDPRSPIRGADLGDDYRSGIVNQLLLESCKKEPYRPADFDLPLNYKKQAGLAEIIFTCDKLTRL